jgi:hypothetical protein
MGTGLKQRSKFLSIFFWNFVLECWKKLEKRKILKKKKILRILIFVGVGTLMNKFWINRRFSHALKITIPAYCD